jgi:hypothetical protein
VTSIYCDASVGNGFEKPSRRCAILGEVTQKCLDSTNALWTKRQVFQLC